MSEQGTDMDQELPGELESADEQIHNIKYINGLYQDWFLDYASYVILERAVPYLYDGLKPVQRRILHSMKRMDDGRYNKVANIIGNTMQFHPHGDASIGDALVSLGQKELLIDMQGNWGNVHTGDRAAAARYIEARLSKFANDVVFNNKTTEWKLSYDGRNKEPVALPVKFPLLLAQGVEGIAVGLASKILPHNFIELIEACIAHLEGRSFILHPDFPTGGLVDVEKYNDGLRGGTVKVRARISKIDSKTLLISELPFGRTTGTLIESIIKAIDKGKIKVKKIDDNTSKNVEILVHLPPGVSPDETMDALYVFTDCEISVSPNSTVISGDKPRFMGVTEMLKASAESTVELLKMELLIRMGELQDDWHRASLEKIFIINEVYEAIKNCKTEEEILEAIETGMKPFVKNLRREITRDDCIRLSNIPIKRISKFSSFKADEYIKGLETEMQEVQHNLDKLIPYSIAYYRDILKKHGQGKERKTEIRCFEAIEATQVVMANTKLYASLADGFIGTGLKKDEFMFDCSDIDEIIVFRENGAFTVVKVAEKIFIGKGIVHVGIFHRNDERTIYNAIYHDGETGVAYQKRFAVTGINRDKEYNLTKGTTGSKILYFSANANGEAEIVKVLLKPKPFLKKTFFEIDFSQVAIKGRAAQGNIITKHAVHKIKKIEEGVSTLGGRKIWFDTVTKRLNTDSRGIYLGEFKGADKIIFFSAQGAYHLSSFDLSNHYEDELFLIEKYDHAKIYTSVFFDAEQGHVYIKRFCAEDSAKPVSIIGEHKDSHMMLLNSDMFPQVQIQFGGKHKHREPENIDVYEFIGVKSPKARGKRLTTFEIGEVVFIEPLEKEIEIEEPEKNGPDSGTDTESRDPLAGNWHGTQQTLFD
jgi:topoisomerase IV subunit A